MRLSNSKKQLAKIIHENGGWREGTEFTAQDGDGTGSIDFFKSKPRLYRNDRFWRGNYDCDDRIERTGVTIKNWHQTILYRDEYFRLYPAPDADGWIEWNGGECPVGIDEIVDVRQLDGRTYTARAVNFHWLLKSGSVSVASYRLHKPEVKPEFCESVMRSIPEPELDDSESRLAKALELVKSAAPHMLRDKYKFDGNEVMGERKPTIEQLALDYRNKLYYANRKQDEADKANMESDAALAQLEDAIAEIGFATTPLAATEKEPELVITDWRDLRVGDVISVSGEWWEPDSEYTVDENDGSRNAPIKVGAYWAFIDECSFKFIRRP